MPEPTAGDPAPLEGLAVAALAEAEPDPAPAEAALAAAPAEVGPALVGAAEEDVEVAVATCNTYRADEKVSGKGGASGERLHSRRGSQSTGRSCSWTKRAREGCKGG